MNYKSVFGVALSTAFLFTFTGSTSHVLGQSTQGSILGTVTDATGASVDGATVVVKNQGTNFVREIKSDSDGDYRVPGLEAGLYQIRVTAAGFKTLERTKIDLVSSQAKRIDLKLELGDVATTVTVEGGSSQIETETVSLSNVKTSRDFAQLPLSVFGRGWANITNVTAGIQSTSGFEVNGARDVANNFTADGISVNDMISSRNTANGFSGDVETFQEIKIITANTSAEYPQVAQFMAVSKQGSNSYHGSFYWGIFNSNFSARSWPQLVAPAFTNHNMYVANGGGPVIIPGLYNGKNKTFFFASYNGALYRVGARSTLTLPTTAMRSGDFSSLLSASTPIILRDSLNGNAPFPNNSLAGRISPISQKVQDLLYPNPNQPGAGIYGLTGNYYADPGQKYDSNVYSFRVDQKISNKNLLFTRVGLTIDNKDHNQGPLKSGYGPGSIIQNIPGRSVVISDTHSFSPTLVQEAKLGFNRTYSNNADTNFGVDINSQLGIQGISNPNNDPAIGSMPLFSFGGLMPVPASVSRNQSYTAQNTYQIIDNISWFRGRHSIKFGTDIRRLQVNNQNKPTNLRGAYSFDDRLSGLSYANFLLGWPSGATRGLARPNAYVRSTYMGFFVQDDFKLRQNVTLNMGIRYEYQTPWVEKFDRMFTFDPASGSMVTAGSSIPTDLVPAIVSTVAIKTAADVKLPLRSLMQNDSNNFSPRLGLAYRPFGNANTVVRAGIGIYNQFWPGLLGLNQTGGPWQSNETFDIVDANTPLVQFPSPFKTNSAFAGIQTISGVSANFPVEKTYQWNLSLGKQIWGTAIDIGYVGTRALNIPYSEDLNLLRPSTLAFNPANRPYSKFSTASLIQTGGSSSYHGFTLQADRRMAGGLWFNVNYTYAKGITDTDLRNYSSGAQQNQYARFQERSDDGNLRRQQLRFSYLYDLPYGRGQRFGNGIPRVVDFVVGGWQVVGITTMTTGALLSPAFSGIDPTGTGQTGGRPDRIGDGNFDSDSMRDLLKARKPILDLAAFVAPAANRGFYGNSARYVLVGPGQAIWNTGMHKNWKFGETKQMQFRWEAFNAFNRINFNNPTTNIIGGSFGLVTSAQSGRSMLFGLRLEL
jgi:hypothetical protein